MGRHNSISREQADVLRDSLEAGATSLREGRRRVLRYQSSQNQPSIDYVRPDARAALLDATNALARAVPVLAELVSRGEPANDAVRARRSK